MKAAAPTPPPAQGSALASSSAAAAASAAASEAPSTARRSSLTSHVPQARLERGMGDSDVTITDLSEDPLLSLPTLEEATAGSNMSRFYNQLLREKDDALQKVVSFRRRVCLLVWRFACSLSVVAVFWIWCSLCRCV